MTDDLAEERRRTLRLSPPPGSPPGATVYAYRGSPDILLLRLPEPDRATGQPRGVIWTGWGGFSPSILLDAALKFGYWTVLP